MKQQTNSSNKSYSNLEQSNKKVLLLLLWGKQSLANILRTNSKSRKIKFVLTIPCLTVSQHSRLSCTLELVNVTDDIMKGACIHQSLKNVFYYFYTAYCYKYTFFLLNSQKFITSHLLIMWYKSLTTIWPLLSQKRGNCFMMTVFNRLFSWSWIKSWIYTSSGLWTGWSSHTSKTGDECRRENNFGVERSLWELHASVLSSAAVSVYTGQHFFHPLPVHLRVSCVISKRTIKSPRHFVQAYTRHWRQSIGKSFTICVVGEIR